MFDRRADQLIIPLITLPHNDQSARSSVACDSRDRTFREGEIMGGRELIVIEPLH